MTSKRPTFGEAMAEAGYGKEAEPEPAIRDVRVPESEPLPTSLDEIKDQPVQSQYTAGANPNYDNPNEQLSDEDVQAGVRRIPLPGESRSQSRRLDAQGAPGAEVTATDDTARKRALAKAIGLDKATPEQRELALAWANRYSLDLLLRHIVIIDGKPFITRDGLLHVAHRSEQLDGIEVSKPVIEAWENERLYWTAEAAVYRRDMSHPFRFTGRYPVNGQNAKYGPEMAVKVAESMSLRRAFDVAAPVAEERSDYEAEGDEQPGYGGTD